MSATRCICTRWVPRGRLIGPTSHLRLDTQIDLGWDDNTESDLANYKEHGVRVHDGPRPPRCNALHG